MRKRKLMAGMYLAALRCLNESSAIDSNSAELHRQTAHFNAAGELLFFDNERMLTECSQ
jgi:hypothetical protein